MNATLFQIFTVRNANGQFLGTYRAKNARHAVQRLIDDQAAYNATFRSQSFKLDPATLTAAVEATRIVHDEWTTDPREDACGW